MSNCKSMVVLPFETKCVADEFERQNEQVMRIVNESSRRAKMKAIAAKRRKIMKIRKAVEIFKVSVIGFFCAVGLITFLAIVL